MRELRPVNKKIGLNGLFRRLDNVISCDVARQGKIEKHESPIPRDFVTLVEKLFRSIAGILKE